MDVLDIEILINVLEDIYKCKYKYEMAFDKGDHIINILRHFRNWVENNRQGDNDRLNYDCDAYYYKNYAMKKDDEALHGDTMVSFWQPYKLAVNLLYNENFNKDRACLSWLIEDKQKYIKELDQEFCGLFSRFADLCYTKGNFILLPPGGRRIQRRGGWYEDRIDKSILECFSEIKTQEGKVRTGVFSKYFLKSCSVEEWIIDQNLNIKPLFKNDNEVISEETLDPFNDDIPYIRFFYKSKSAMTKEQLKIYLKKVIQLIERRNDN